MKEDKINKMVDGIIQAIDTRMEKKPKSYFTQAKVIRTENGTAYVHIPGGVDETPVKETIACRKGDTVQVRVGDGSAVLVGNQTAPPTDDAEALVARAVAKVADKNATEAKTTADEAQQTANAVSGIANLALTEASEAKQIADDTEQHFWITETGTDTGAHITEVPQEEWSDPSDPNYQSGGNLLARSNGIAVRDGLTELASFGATESIMGPVDSRNVRITANGLEFYDKTNDQGGLLYNTVNIYGGTRKRLTLQAMAIDNSSARLIEDVNPSTLNSETVLESVYNMGSYSTFGRLLIRDNHSKFTFGTANSGVETSTGVIEFSGSGNITASGGITTTGNASIGGDVTVGGHATPIGYNGTTTNTTATRADSTSYAGIGLQVSLPKGVWMLTGTITFASNTTGRRAVRLTDAGTAIACSEVVSPPANGAATALHTSAVVENTTSSNRTYAMQCYQNSGATRNVTGELRYVRIA